MSNSSGNTSSSTRNSVQFDPSLLQPIVRSKRTPIACTECRRRQVKCSGTTPRCERCQKKGIECTYMSLSEQRAVSGGSISRSGTPTSMSASHGSAGHLPMQGVRPGHLPGWQTSGQTYAAGTAYAVPQGWRASSPAPGSAVGQYNAQTNQSFSGVPMAYPQGYSQHVSYTQDGSTSQGGANLYAQNYAPEGYANTTSYNTYGHVASATDSRYAYQSAQMTAMSGNQQSAGYVGQYQQQQQMYFDPSTGQMISGAGQWTDSTDTGYQDPTYPGQN